MKNQKGITLIALVITIIVLLILAGISIAMLTGDEGILTKASDSAVENNIGAAKDQIAMAANTGMEEYYEAKYVTNTLSSNTQQTYVEQEITKLVTKGVSGVTISLDSHVVTITPTDTTKADKAVKATIGTDGKLDAWGPVGAGA